MIPGLPRGAHNPEGHYETTAQLQYAPSASAPRSSVLPSSSYAARTYDLLSNGGAGDKSYRTAGIGSRNEEGARDPSAAPPLPPVPANPALQRTHIRMGGEDEGTKGWSTSHHDMFVDRGEGRVESASSRAELVRTSFRLGNGTTEYSTTSAASRHFKQMAEAAAPEPSPAAVAASEAAAEKGARKGGLKELLACSHIHFGRRDSRGRDKEGEQYVSQSRRDFVPHGDGARRSAEGSRAKLVRSNLHFGVVAPGEPAREGHYTSSFAASAYYRPL